MRFLRNVANQARRNIFTTLPPQISPWRMQTLIESQLQASQPLAAAILVERGAHWKKSEQRLRTRSRKGSATYGARATTFSRSCDFRVARERELRFLSERLGKMCTRLGSITLVHGDAGIGKSTFAGARRSAALPFFSDCRRNSLRSKLARAADASFITSGDEAFPVRSSSTTRKTSQRMRFRSSRFSLKRGANGTARRSRRWKLSAVSGAALRSKSDSSSDDVALALRQAMNPFQRYSVKLFES